MWLEYRVKQLHTKVDFDVSGENLKLIEGDSGMVDSCAKDMVQIAAR